MKRIIESFVKLVTLTALIHVLVLTIKAIKEKNFQSLNYFGILDLNAFFPKITQGRLSDIISFLLALIIFGIFLFFSFYKDNEKDRD